MSLLNKSQVNWPRLPRITLNRLPQPIRKRQQRTSTPLMLKTDENYRVQGFPKKANPEEIKKDLEKEGFEPERVTQLVGRRTKQLLPIFQVTLPRTIENLKIFDLKTLAHLNITVDGYNGGGHAVLLLQQFSP
ncbi:hypothetical protein TNCV_4536571 [Trichonephila clavipes]|nr:hypothetical protein TNCV_4536571 [Trichonephila clavipes]